MSKDSRLLTGVAIRKWMAYARNDVVADLRVGPSAADPLARQVWADIQKGKHDSFISIRGSADRLFALASVVTEDEGADPRPVASCYRLLEGVHWPTDLFCERGDVLSRIAYCAWRQHRRAGDYAAARSWEQKALDLATRQPAVQDFLALPLSSLTPRLCSRFFIEPAVLLAMSLRIRQTLDQSPTRGLAAILAVLESLVTETLAIIGPNERSYFVAQMEMFAAIVHKSRGHFREAHEWLDRASSSCRAVIGASDLSTRILFVRRVLAHDQRLYDAALEGLPAVRERFAALGLENFVVRCWYLEGQAQKELGNDDRAFDCLKRVTESSGPAAELWLTAMALCLLAQIHAKRDRGDLAFESLRSAWGLLKDSEVAMAVGFFHATHGELFRDRGQLGSAVAAYRRSVNWYQAADMGSLAAYTRVVLAETLLASGRSGEALSEIVTALPTIECLGLEREGLAAVQLLRRSVSRRQLDRTALAAIKAALQRAK